MHRDHRLARRGADTLSRAPRSFRVDRDPHPGSRDESASHRFGRAHEDVRHVIGVGVGDAVRVEPAARLPLGVEADASRRAGQEPEDPRELHELLEVEHHVVAARAQDPEQFHDRAQKGRVAPHVDREGSRDETTLAQQRDVARQRQEVDLALGSGDLPSHRLQRGQDHRDVAEAVELDGEDPARSGNRLGFLRRRREQRRHDPPPLQETDHAAAEPEQPGQPQPAPAVEVAREVQIHRFTASNSARASRPVQRPASTSARTPSLTSGEKS